MNASSEHIKEKKRENFAMLFLPRDKAVSTQAKRFLFLFITKMCNFVPELPVFFQSENTQ